MDLTTSAIVVAALSHGEHGAVVRFLTERNGLVAGYVPGGRSRAKRASVQPGSGVMVRVRAVTGALGSATVELVRSRTVLATERLTAAALEYSCALVATVLDEGQPCPRLYVALDALLDVMALASVPDQWLAGLVSFELLLLAELGFGLDLATCAATGAADADLAFVSPKSSHAVGRGAGLPYADKLLPLPAFLLNGGTAPRSDIVAGLRTTGYFLERDVLTGRAAALLAARARLVGMV